MQWLFEHYQDILIAAVLAIVFAAVFAVIADAISIGSRVREQIRWLANRRAERSLTKLQARIRALEHRRKMLSSRTAILLLALQAALRTMFLLSVGLVCVSFGVSDVPNLTARLDVYLDKARHYASGPAPWVESFLRAELAFVCVLLFALSASSALAGLKLARVDSEERLARAVAQLDREIAVLRRKEVAFVRVQP